MRSPPRGCYEQGVTQCGYKLGVAGEGGTRHINDPEGKWMLRYDPKGQWIVIRNLMFQAHRDAIFNGLI